MAALQLDVGGSSTSAANISSGGNAGIQFAPKGVSAGTVAVIGVALVAAWFILGRRGRK